MYTCEFGSVLVPYWSTWFCSIMFVWWFLLQSWFCVNIYTWPCLCHDSIFDPLYMRACFCHGFTLTNISEFVILNFYHNPSIGQFYDSWTCCGISLIYVCVFCPCLDFGLINTCFFLINIWIFAYVISQYVIFCAGIVLAWSIHMTVCCDSSLIRAYTF